MSIPKFRYIWPLLASILGGVALWVEETNEFLGRHYQTFSEDVITSWGNSKPNWIYVNVLEFQIGTLFILAIALHQVRSKTFEGDQGKGLTVLILLWMIYTILNLDLNGSQVVFFPLSGCMAIGVGVLLWLRHIRKSPSLKTKYTKWKVVIAIMCLLIFPFHGIWTLIDFFGDREWFSNYMYQEIYLIYLFLLHIFIPLCFLLHMLDNHIYSIQKGAFEKEEKLIEELGK